MPARLQYTPHLAECGIDAGDIPQPEPDRVKIDAAVRHRKSLGIGTHPLDPVENPLVDGAGASDREHCFADITNDRATASGIFFRNEARHGAQCDIAGTTGDIEETLPCARLQQSEHLRFPSTVDTGAHQIVHQIVARRDTLEESTHKRRLLALRHAAEPEIGATACVFIAHRAGR